MHPTSAGSNSLMRESYPILQMIQPLREQMLAVLTDEDLEFALPGNPTLGALCRQMGEVQASYIQSFRDFAMTYGDRSGRQDVEQQVQALRDWYQQLDEELASVLAGLSEADIHERQIQRPGFTLSPALQLMVYREALFIFYGKASVYLQALNKSMPRQWQDWVG